jgi:hypothetical protein
MYPFELTCPVKIFPCISMSLFLELDAGVQVFADYVSRTCDQVN